MWGRVTTLLIFALFLVAGYPNYNPLPIITVSILASMLYFVIGVTPLHVGNELILNISDSIVRVNVSTECSGAMLLFIFAILMFIMPGIENKDRYLSLLLLPIVYGLNVIRIFVSAVTGIYTDLNMLVLVHDSIGQVFILVSSVSLYLIYLYKLGYIRRETNA